MVESHVIDDIAACGETDDAYRLGVDTILLRILADVGDRNPGIIPRHLPVITLFFGNLRVLLGEFPHAGIPSLVAVRMVGHISGLLIIGARICGAVFQDEGGDAVRGKPFGHVGAFLMPGQRGETAAWAYDDGSPRLGTFRREI